MGPVLSTMRAAHVGADGEAAAEAAADVAAALATVGRAMRGSSMHSNLQKREMLSALELEDDAEANAEELKEELRAAEAFADGEAGDRVKYMAAGKSHVEALATLPGNLQHRRGRGANGGDGQGVHGIPLQVPAKAKRPWPRGPGR